MVIPEVFMRSSPSSSVDRLPSRFPVGTRFVIEGRGGRQGRMRISLRRLEFPDGRKLDLPVEEAERTAPRRGSTRRPRARK
jgi:hypothetical protein